MRTRAELPLNAMSQSPDPRFPAGQPGPQQGQGNVTPGGNAPWSGPSAPGQRPYQQNPGWTPSGPQQAGPSQFPAPGQYPNQAGQYPGQAGQYPGQPGAPGQSSGSGQQAWAGDDARRPIGQAPLPSVDINQFTEPKSKAPWIVGVIVGLIAGALVFAAVKVSNDPQPVNTPTPTPTASAPATEPTGVPSGNSVGFSSEREGAEGYWIIDKQEWTSTGLELTITIHVTKGTMRFTFFALDDKTATDYDPLPGSGNDITSGSVGEGQSVTGTIVFEKNRAATTIYLADGTGRQVSALRAHD